MLFQANMNNNMQEQGDEDFCFPEAVLKQPWEALCHFGRELMKLRENPQDRADPLDILVIFKRTVLCYNKEVPVGYLQAQLCNHTEEMNLSPGGKLF
jgi:hypothetical protein